MSTINITYNDQQVSVDLILDNFTEPMVYIDKHTEIEDIADMIYHLLDTVTGAYNLNIEKEE